MAEHKVQPSSMLLIIQTIDRGQTINNTVVCLKSITKNDSVNVIDANSWCGQKKLAGLSDISYNFECIHLQDPEGDKLSGTNLRVLAYQKLPIYYKIIPEVPQPGDEFEEGYGFISDISSNYSFDSVGTFSMTITAKGTPELFSFNNIVTIGDQIWSSKNLDVTQFRDGTPIVKANNVYDWTYCTNNDIACWAHLAFSDGFSDYGKYYNQNAINSIKNLAPKYYKIPSSNDINRLISFVSTQYISPAYALRGSDAEHWNDDDGFDAYGFTLQGNYLLNYNEYSGIGNAAYLSTSDEKIVVVGLEDPNVGIINYFAREYGFNIRLLLDI